MAGVHFSFYDFPSLLKLNMGIADRLDESRAECFTVLFCDYTKYSDATLQESLKIVTRDSDSIVHFDKYYFFVFPYTDKYGTSIVKDKLVDVLDNKELKTLAISYPIDGETPKELLAELQFQLFQKYSVDLECFDNKMFEKSGAMSR
jgi:hypothetical protein